MNIRYDNGLLFMDIEISYLGESKLIKNVVIDTGASHTIISPDIVSRCKNKFGFNRLFYIDWVIDNERFLNFAYILMDKEKKLT